MVEMQVFDFIAVISNGMIQCVSSIV